MGEENKNWFARHRTAVLGIAIAVLILNVVVLAVVPTQTPVELSQTVTEYALDDEAFAQPHTLTLTGTLTKSMLHKSLFHGTLTISGYDELDDMTLHLERKNKRWQGNFNTAAGQPMTTVVHELYGTKNFESLVLDLWTSIEEADDGRMHYEFDLPAAHILALGADSRQAALRRYQGYVDFAQK